MLLPNLGYDTERVIDKRNAAGDLRQSTSDASKEITGLPDGVAMLLDLARVVRAMNPIPWPGIGIENKRRLTLVDDLNHPLGLIRLLDADAGRNAKVLLVSQVVGDQSPG